MVMVLVVSIGSKGSGNGGLEGWLGDEDKAVLVVVVVVVLLAMLVVEAVVGKGGDGEIVFCFLMRGCGGDEGVVSSSDMSS